MAEFGDWLVHHPTSSVPFNVLFWLLVVGVILRFVLLLVFGRNAR